MKQQISNNLKKINSVTMLAGVFAAVSVQNVAHFFIDLHHPAAASWTLGIAIGSALVILAHLLSEVDMRERKAFLGLLTVTLILVSLSGTIQGLAYARELGNMGYVLSFTLAATGEIVLPLAHAWHGEAKRRRTVNDAGQRVEEIAAQTLVDTMSGVDVARAQRQAEIRIEQLVVAHVDSIVQKLMPVSTVQLNESQSIQTQNRTIETTCEPFNAEPPQETIERIEQPKSNAKDRAIERLLAFYVDNPNASLSEAGSAIGRSKSTIKNYLDELQNSGRVHVNGSVEVIG